MIAINNEHHEYKARNTLWRQYRDLYAGGAQFKSQAASYLVRRQKEPYEVYQERLDRSFYENYVGSIVDWYGATLFRREPVIAFEGNNDPARRFFNTFIEDCDRKGTNLSDFFRKQIVDSLVCGVSYLLVDFPRQTGPAPSRAAEEENGASRAYLVGYGPEELINWSYDEHGEYEWVVLRTSQLRRQRLEDPEPLVETYWHYYDRERFSTYRQIGKQAMLQQGAEAAPIELTAKGFHGLASLKRVPLFELKLADGMWLLNRAAQLQLEHFNKSNALSWALTMGLFAMPVVYTDKDWKQLMGESYYIQLGSNDRFGWAEPEGHVYEIAAKNLSRLKEEIYRVCYMMSMIGPASSEGQAVSGVSKQRDFAITQEVLRAFGDTVKDTIRRVLTVIEAARSDGLSVTVSGLDEFDIGDFTTEVEDARKLLDLGADSPTLKRQVFKKLAFKFLCDERQEMKDTIAREIDEWIAGQKT